MLQDISHQYQEEEDLDTVLADIDSFHHQLIVWNDDVNTFDWVITSLVEVCDHTIEQAEQYALFIHFKGKYAVKTGNSEVLHPMCKALLDRGISATVESEVNS